MRRRPEHGGLGLSRTARTYGVDCRLCLAAGARGGGGGMKRFAHGASALLTLVHVAVAFSPIFDWIVLDVIGAPPETLAPGRLGMQLADVLVRRHLEAGRVHGRDERGARHRAAVVAESLRERRDF